MGYIRKMAVHAIRERGESPEIVAQIFDFNRSCIYRWLKQYDEGGYAAWESRMPPGASPLITEEMDEWLKQTVLNRTPVDFGYDTTLWTCALLADLLQKEFAITVTGGAVSLHLNKLGLSYQKPAYPDVERDPQEVEQFLNDKFPSIQRLADKMGADIGFEDEAGVRGYDRQNPGSPRQHEKRRVSRLVQGDRPRRNEILGHRRPHPVGTLHSYAS
jgi:transposase